MNRTNYIKAVIILTFIIQHVVVMADTFGAANAVDDQAIVLENSESNLIDIFINDTIGKGDGITGFTHPVNGEVELGLFGVTYQPNDNYCNNGTITDDFTYTLTGGSTATVFVTVTCITTRLAPQIVPVNQFQWLLLLILTIIIVVKIQKSDSGLL